MIKIEHSNRYPYIMYAADRQGVVLAFATCKKRWLEPNGRPGQRLGKIYFSKRARAILTFEQRAYIIGCMIRDETGRVEFPGTSLVVKSTHVTPA